MCSSRSIRYLEELSQSYRRQMERLSRSFNLTYAWLKVTAHGAEERDRQQQVNTSSSSSVQLYIHVLFL
ncbi:unnamed protein product [Trichobilharzia regenti]|nr:unnamed protein product [Trichobilharzia regenti]